jgi:ribosomal protein S18 acetylase RimI-like enzyme
VSVRSLRGDEALPLAAAVWLCYHQVFGDFADYATWRSELFDRHAARDGYRLVVASDPDDDAVVGFAWGYVGQRGEYWPDRVLAALPPDVGATWVGDHLEVVELAVLPSHRRAGLGQRLHDAVLSGVSRRCLLGTTDDPDDPAVRLYLRSGWRTLGALGPGVQVMGLDLRDGAML